MNLWDMYRWSIRVKKEVLKVNILSPEVKEKKNKIETLIHRGWRIIMIVIKLITVVYQDISHKVDLENDVDFGSYWIDFIRGLWCGGEEDHILVLIVYYL